MIEYFEQLTQEEQEDLTDVIGFSIDRHFFWRGSLTSVRADSSIRESTVSAKSTLIF